MTAQFGHVFFADFSSSNLCELTFDHSRSVALQAKKENQLDLRRPPIKKSGTASAPLPFFIILCPSLHPACT